VSDLILWCGPVVLTNEFREIDWYGRDVRIVTISGSGSSYFSQMGDTFRGSDGRILPALLRRYTPRDVTQLDKIVLGAYSAGWGLLEKIARVDADRQRISAYMLSDACFGGGKRGYEKAAVDAVRGKLLMVATTAHTTPGGYPTGRDSWQMVWDYAAEQTGKSDRLITPREPVPSASGGWHRMGSALYWGSYTVPGSPENAGNDLTHEEHHYLAPEVWQAYLAPWLSGRLGFPWVSLLAGAAVGAAGGYAAYELKR